jgi:septum formation inhibitor MinC
MNFEFTAETILLIIAGILIGGVASYLKSLLTIRKHKKELQEYKDHLDRQMKITNAGNSTLVLDLEKVKKENENLRISVQTLNQKPGRAELRLLNIYDAALRKMMSQAPGFSTAWENSLQEAEREYEANESGLKSIVSKVFGSGTGVVHDTASIHQIESK